MLEHFLLVQGQIAELDQQLGNVNHGTERGLQIMAGHQLHIDAQPFLQ